MNRKLIASILVVLLMFLIFWSISAWNKKRIGNPLRLNCKSLTLAAGNCLSELCHSSFLQPVLVSECPLASKDFYFPRHPLSPEENVLVSEDLSSMVHENRPWLVLRHADELRRSLSPHINLPQESRIDGATIIYLRCSDVPNESNDIYELLEYEWYLDALRLLPPSLVQRIEIRLCVRHNIPEGDEERQLNICREYALGLKEVVSRRLGVHCDFYPLCQSTQEDFLYLCSSEALIVGGCGGSFGFWAGVLAPPQAHVVMPSPRCPRFMELGSPAEIKVGKKVILRAERIRNKLLRDNGIKLTDVEKVLSLCRKVRRPAWPPYDGLAYYINREQDETRGSHMKNEMRAHGFRATRVEPLVSKSPVKSLTQTHLHILELIASKKEGWTAIFEDDVQFHGDGILGQVNDFLLAANMFAYLGLCFTERSHVDSCYKRGRCSHAYVVCPEGAAYLAWIIRDNKYDQLGEHIDVVLQRHVSALLLRGDLSGHEAGHQGLAFQARKAEWYEKSIDH